MPSNTVPIVLLVTRRPGVAADLCAAIGWPDDEPPFVVESVAEARRLCRLLRFDLVLFDSGAVTAAELAEARAFEAERAVPVLLVGDLPAPEVGRRQGLARRCLLTPLSPQVLAEALDLRRSGSGALGGGQRVDEAVHDVKGFLTVALGYGQLLVEELAAGGQQRQMAELTLRSVGYARDVLGLVLAPGGGQQPGLAQLDVAGLAREVGEWLRRSLGPGISVRYRLGEGLPAVCGSGVELRRLLLNLLSNAAAAIDGAGTITLSVVGATLTPPILAQCQVGGTAAPGRFLCLKVRDTGRGMDQTLLGQVFAPRLTTRRDGLGLGLPSVEQIVLRHRGAIRVRSARGRGTTVAVYLPPAGQGAEPCPQAGDGGRR